MKTSSLFLQALLMMLTLTELVSEAHRSPLQAPALSREERWKQDLDTFAREFAQNQKNFAELYPRDRFARDLTALQESVVKSTDAEIVLELMKLVASAHVAHTTVYFPRGQFAFHRLSIRMYWFSDGLAVTGAASEYREALGTRVLRIGTMTPEQLKAAVAPYISYENDIWLRQTSPTSITIVELLQHLKIAESDGSVVLQLAKPDGSQFTMKVLPAPLDSVAQLINMTDTLHLPVPLFRKRPNAHYWYEYLPDSQAIYLQYNRCQDDPEQPFADFAKGVFAFMDAHPIQRVIVDLRFNSGGNSSVIKPLEQGLQSRSALRGHIFALIGRDTFSSGLMAAVDFRNDLHAVLIGESSGEKPNHYGEVRTFTLPYSQIEVQYSTKYHQVVRQTDPLTFDPDITVLRSLADVFAGRDPVLDAALPQPSQ